MVASEKLFINNNEIKLEAEYFESSSDTTSAVIICHPHPQFGGNMWNNVVSEIFKTLIENNTSCLRFNFRGVGESTGSHSSGNGELSDIKACIEFLINRKGIQKIIISGYSYGAAIGCSAVNYSEKIVGFIAFSFPFDFMGLKYKKLSQTNKPKLFIQGNKDEVASYSNFYEHYEFYENPKDYKIIDGADHFYWGYETQAVQEMLKFYKSIT